MRIILTLLLCYASVGAQNWHKPDTSRNIRQFDNFGRTKIKVGQEANGQAVNLEWISWPGLDDSTYLRVQVDVGFNPVSFDGDTAFFGIDDFKGRIFNTADNRMEWDFTFQSKPGNQFSWTFPIQYSNLVFYYQPELTAEEIANGEHRPDSVVGSYAVYHSYQAHNGYKTGKALHIYRPKAFDAAGDTVWLDQFIDTTNNTLTISATRSWMRNATYPVTFDPIFGADSIGGSNGSLNGEYKMVCEFPLTEDGDVTKVTRYTQGTNIATKGVIYDDGGSAPDALQGTSTEVTVTAGAAWFDFTFDPAISLTGSNNYYIGNLAGGRIDHYYDAGASNQNVYNLDTYSDGPSDPFGTPNNLDRILSVYATYTTGTETHPAGSYDQGTNWTNPGNATGAPDNSCAIYDAGNQDILTLHNFGFNIPTDATIDSINIDFDGYGTQSQVARRDLEVQLTKTGGGANTGVGDLLENVRMVEGANCAASGIYNITGQTLWNTTWTYSEINAATFGLNIADDDGNAHELGVDAVYITVHYTEAGVGGYAGQAIMIGGQ